MLLPREVPHVRHFRTDEIFQLDVGDKVECAGSDDNITLAMLADEMADGKHENIEKGMLTRCEDGVSIEYESGQTENFEFGDEQFTWGAEENMYIMRYDALDGIIGTEQLGDAEVEGGRCCRRG